MTRTAGRIVAVIALLAIAVLVVRNAAVAAFAEHSPAPAAAFWPAHPATEISCAMTAIATAPERVRFMAAPLGRVAWFMKRVVTLDSRLRTRGRAMARPA